MDWDGSRQDPLDAVVYVCTPSNEVSLVRRWITLPTVSVAAAVLVPAAPSAADSVPVAIFEDGFESGDLSNWDTVATDRFAVTSDQSHVLTGSYALEGTIDDGSPRFDQQVVPPRIRRGIRPVQRDVRARISEHAR